MLSDGYIAMRYISKHMYIISIYTCYNVKYILDRIVVRCYICGMPKYCS